MTHLLFRWWFKSFIFQYILTYADNTTLPVKSEEKLKSLLMRWKRRMKKLAYNSALKKLGSWHAVTQFMPNRRGNIGSRDKFYFLGIQRMMWMWCMWMMHEYDVHSCTCMWMMTAAMELKDAYLKESYDKHRQHFKKQRHHFAYKGLSSQSYGFSSNCVWMWELDHKEGWVPKSWCFWTIVLEKTQSLQQQGEQTSQS